MKINSLINTAFKRTICNTAIERKPQITLCKRYKTILAFKRLINFFRFIYPSSRFVNLLVVGIKRTIKRDGRKVEHFDRLTNEAFPLREIVFQEKREIEKLPFSLTF